MPSYTIYMVDTHLLKRINFLKNIFDRNYVYFNILVIIIFFFKV